ncbi:hypothetical protein SAMD00023519_00695 [Listeria monocytogenes]|nr:hypothetical protein SAMD00023519_00695 [Listeria monocytogenes]
MSTIVHSFSSITSKPAFTRNPMPASFFRLTSSNITIPPQSV